MTDHASAAPSAAPAFAGEALLIITDADGRVLCFNAGCERLFGVAVTEVMGQPLADALHEGGLPGCLVQQLRRLQAGEQPPPQVRSVVAADGRRRTVCWSSSLLKAAPDVPLLVSAGIDVTDTERDNAARFEDAARLHAVLEAAVDGIITIDEHSRIESVNPAVERLFGWREAELLGQSVNMLMPEPYQSQHDGYMSHYLDTGERRIIGIGREVEGRRKDGSVFPLELAVSEVCLPGRRLFTGIVRDVSQRRLAEQQARQRLEELAHASRLADLGELTSSIAHEINQPLAAIVSFADACLRMLRAGTGSPEVLRGALEQISAQGERAGDIVHNLRQFVHKGSTTRTQVDVNKVIRDVLGLLSHDLRQRRVRVQLLLDESLPEVSADRVQVGQVTLNLVRNALEAIGEDEGSPREIRISTARSGQHLLEVSVSDTGVGLPPEGPQRVFETFFTTKPQGMGIGLSICRSLVEAHGGRLTAESNQQAGATFRFTLPLSAADDDAV